MSDFNEIYKALQLDKKIPEKLSNTASRPEEKERRTGLERRRFVYSQHVPDKRSGLDRRNILHMDIEESS